jgi:ribosomal protein S18 acetylase RimI-like enzyme
MTAYTMRSATMQDLPWLFVAKEEAYRAYVEEIWGRWDEAFQRQWLEEEFTRTTTRIINSDNRYIGFLQTDDETRRTFIRNLVIAQPYQGRGIGTAILHSIMTAAAAGGRAVELGVFKINDRARALYERLGFITTGETGTHFEMRWRGGPTP